MKRGYLVSQGLRIQDEMFGALVLTHIKRTDQDCFVYESGNDFAWIEAFDAPLVAVNFGIHAGEVIGIFPYGVEIPLDIHTFSVDEWDRFHCQTKDKIPVVLSRAAQASLFNSADSFDDNSFTILGQRIETKPWLISNSDANSPQFWTEFYESQSAPWDLGEPAPALTSILSQIKRPRSNCLVLGCGAGHDAAYLAQMGHVVTAVDLSPAAIAKAKQLYGHLRDLTFVAGDGLEKRPDWRGRFDLIFEHTFYCAIDPRRRNELVKSWWTYLVDGGHLLGIFFVMDRLSGPPWGGSEWELRQRLRPYLDFRYWTRWRQSKPKRQNFELIIYAEKRRG